MYRLEIAKAVQRQIDALPGNYRQRIRAVIKALASNPRPSTAILLRQQHNLYRIAIDHYRLVYAIEDEILQVEVLKVGSKHGPEFYAGLG